jgi:GT2 family glycosyltransferase
MRPITFCIPTAKNERDYVLLLLKSLIDNTQHHLHEFLVFIDSDNQNTFDALVEFKSALPTLKIYRNTGEFPVGGQRNISIMFDAAKNDVVCYLQSDMVVSENFDIHLNQELLSENQVLSFTRIEPPLHPASPEKIVKDFGITPEEFNYTDFLKFSATIRREARPNTNGHFAPFAIFKKTWIDRMGGFDTQFRCSREDSDTILRFELNGIETIQTWKAMVYHFTCVSSRGHEWFIKNKSKEADLTLQMQTLADNEELKRYIRKWGFFGHTPRPVYDVTFFIQVDAVVNFEVLKFIEPFCTRLIITDESIANHLRQRVEFDARYYSNYRWKYTEAHWNSVNYLFNPTNWESRIQYQPTLSTTSGTMVKCNYSAMNNLSDPETRQIFENIHSIVAGHDVGEYKFNDITIHIFDKIDIKESLKKTPNSELILKQDKFIFS